MRIYSGDEKRLGSEDVRSSICRCLASLFKAATDQVLLEVKEQYSSYNY